MLKSKKDKYLKERKWRRMRLILDKLKEGSMPFHEIEQLFSKSAPDYVMTRTVQDYLAEFVGIGIITYDAQNGVYQLAESRRVFQSRHDYDIALKHSKRLLFTTNDRPHQRLDQTNRHYALDLIVFSDLKTGGANIDDQCVFQHVKTGYSELYLLMQKYRHMIGETRPFPTEPAGGPQETSEENALTNEEAKKSEKKSKAVADLSDLLVGKLDDLLNYVKNGTPLQGFCDYCPDKKITIKDF